MINSSNPVESIINIPIKLAPPIGLSPDGQSLQLLLAAPPQFPLPLAATCGERRGSRAALEIVFNGPTRCVLLFHLVSSFYDFFWSNFDPYSNMSAKNMTRNLQRTSSALIPSPPGVRSSGCTIAMSADGAMIAYGSTRDKTSQSCQILPIHASIPKAIPRSRKNG
jgi:hypothetical protein